MSSLGLNQILIAARQQQASDIHLSAGNPIIFRKNGKLQNVTKEALTEGNARELISQSLPLDVIKKFDETGDGEYVYSLEGQGRFRMSLMKHRDGWELTVRLIPLAIPQPQQVGLPPAAINLTKWAQGMVLITGPAGCGKTTTLASLIEIINNVRNEHIITIESPIEIVYTQSQHAALRASLREDPDILVVSELRDLQSIQLAISAAETGHLVFGTMNTVNAAQTISRLIDSFPTDEQAIMRNMISESLRGVICQQLIPKKDGTGMVAAFEILIVNQSVSSIIRDGKISQLNNVMSTGKSFGMQLMDMTLTSMASSGIISQGEAMERAHNPNTMQLGMQYGSN